MLLFYGLKCKKKSSTREKQNPELVNISKDHINDKMAWFGFMVFNATFNNITVISWRSVLLVEETGGPGENHQPVTSH
jgi:hypothetical protein